MAHLNALSRKLLSLSVATLCLVILSSCNSKVVIGRARPSEPVAKEKVAAKPAQKKPVEVKEAQKEAPATTEIVKEPKPIAASGGGMMGSTSKTEPVQENVAPQTPRNAGPGV
jgi:hypothetical protein